MHKQILKVGGTLVSIMTLMLLLAPHKAAAAPAPWPMSQPGYSATVCQFSTIYGVAIRAVVSKPAGVSAKANLSTWQYPSFPLGGLVGANGSAVWWNDQVTVVEIPANNWTRLLVIDSVNSNTLAYTDYLATVFTPSC